MLRTHVSTAAKGGGGEKGPRDSEGAQMEDRGKPPKSALLEGCLDQAHIPHPTVTGFVW